MSRNTSKRESAFSDSAEDDCSTSYDGDSAGRQDALELQLAFESRLDAPSTDSSALGWSKQGAVVSIAHEVDSERLLLGLEDGTILQWRITCDGAGSLQLLGRHLGAVGCIDTMERPPPATALVISGSADATIKVWACQGLSVKQPALCTQTLHGHDGTVSALAVVLDSCIVTGGKDGCIRLWRSAAALKFLDHPRFEQQAVIATMPGWVRSICYQRPDSVGVLGAVYAADDQGSVVCVAVSTAAAGPNKGLPDFAVEGSITGRGHSNLAFPKAHDRTITRLLHVPAQQLLLTLAFDACLRAHDAVTGVVKYAWRNACGCLFTGLAYILEHSQALAVDARGNVAVYSMDTGTLVATKQLTTEPFIDVTPCLSRPDLFAAVTASGVHVVRVQRSLEYNVMQEGHSKAVLALHAVSNDRQGCEPDYRIFSASHDNTVRVWDPYDMACLNVLPGGASEITAMLFFASWNFLVTGHDNGDVRLWNVDTGSCTTTLHGHANSVTCLCLASHSQQDELLLSGGYDGAVCVWEARTARGSKPHLLARFEAHGMDVASVLAAQAEEGQEGPQKRKQQGRRCAELAGTVAAAVVQAADTSPVPSKRISAAGKLITVEQQRPTASAGKLCDQRGGTDGIKVFDAMARQTQSPETAPTTQPFSTSGVPAASKQRVEASKSSQQRTVQAMLALPAPEIMCLWFDASRGIIFTGGNDNSVRVWNAMSYQLLGQHVGHTSAVTCLALDANILFTGSEDCRIGMWDAVPAAVGATSLPGHPHAGAGPTFFSTAPLHFLCQHTSSITAVELLPQQGLLASCDHDGRLLFWDYVQGAVAAQYSHASEAFSCMALRHDVEELLVGTLSGRILRYRLPSNISAAPGTISLGDVTPT